MTAKNVLKNYQLHWMRRNMKKERGNPSWFVLPGRGGNDLFSGVIPPHHKQNTPSILWGGEKRGGRCNAEGVVIVFHIGGVQGGMGSARMRGGKRKRGDCRSVESQNSSFTQRGASPKTLQKGGGV